MNEQQQELYEKLLKKVNEYCLGYDAEEVIAAIDALVDNYERVNHLPTYYNNLALKYKKALEIIKREPSEVIEIITTYDTWKEYIKDYPISDRTIWHIIKNKSEFYLLKKVLKDESTN